MNVQSKGFQPQILINIQEECLLSTIFASTEITADKPIPWNIITKAFNQHPVNQGLAERRESLISAYCISSLLQIENAKQKKQWAENSPLISSHNFSFLQAIEKANNIRAFVFKSSSVPASSSASFLMAVASAKAATSSLPTAQKVDKIGDAELSPQPQKKLRQESKESARSSSSTHYQWTEEEMIAVQSLYEGEETFSTAIFKNYRQIQPSSKASCSNVRTLWEKMNLDLKEGPWTNKEEEILAGYITHLDLSQKSISIPWANWTRQLTRDLQETKGRHKCAIRDLFSTCLKGMLTGIKKGTCTAENPSLIKKSGNGEYNPKFLKQLLALHNANPLLLKLPSSKILSLLSSEPSSSSSASASSSSASMLPPPPPNRKRKLTLEISTSSADALQQTKDKDLSSHQKVDNVGRTSLSAASIEKKPPTYRWTPKDNEALISICGESKRVTADHFELFQTRRPHCQVTFTQAKSHWITLDSNTKRGAWTDKEEELIAQYIVQLISSRRKRKSLQWSIWTTQLQQDLGEDKKRSRNSLRDLSRSCLGGVLSRIAQGKCTKDNPFLSKHSATTSAHNPEFLKQLLALHEAYPELIKPLIKPHSSLSSSSAVLSSAAAGKPMEDDDSSLPEGEDEMDESVDDNDGTMTAAKILASMSN